jgi:DNA-directed RNA polymerase specialized sigma subunit
VEDLFEGLPETSGGPEKEAEKQQELESLQDGISRLRPDQQLLLRLRFQEGLGLRKIAQLKFHGDVNVAWRQINSAVDALFQQVHKRNSTKKRKN